MEKRLAKPNNTGTNSPQKDGKKQIILALLGRPEGATIAAMQKATGWQQHSVRGFLSGQVRKKLGMALQSQIAEAGRVYRILTEERATHRARKAPKSGSATPKAKKG
jgi:hypothetical protein